MSDFDTDDQSSGGSSITVFLLSSCSLCMIVMLYFVWKTMSGNTTKPNNTTTTPPGTQTTTKVSTTSAPTTQDPVTKVAIGQKCTQSKECSTGVCCGRAGSAGVCFESCEGSATGICEFKYSGNSACDTSKAGGKTKKPETGLKTCKRAKDCPSRVCCGLPGKTGYCMNSCEGTGFCRFTFNGTSVCK